MNTTNDCSPRLVARDAWLAARLTLLREEKELTRRQDALAARRRALPWTRVTQDYVFDSPSGRVTLDDLFVGCRQLIVYHFMFGPGWEEGCKSCSFGADHFDGMRPHLRARDVAFAVVSRAPLAELQPFQTRMGWKFPWVSSHGTTFNYDFQVSFTDDALARGAVHYNYTETPFPFEEAPGYSVFARDAAGRICHTYSTYGRGVEVGMGTYHLLDLVPRGRAEDGLEFSMAWVRHHDRYEHAVATA
jgi:predicted dithiol-disulfide oxidoreductase (DUF899 family)